MVGLQQLLPKLTQRNLRAATVWQLEVESVTFSQKAFGLKFIKTFHTSLFTKLSCWVLTDISVMMATMVAATMTVIEIGDATMDSIITKITTIYVNNQTNNGDAGVKTN